MRARTRARLISTPAFVLNAVIKAGFRIFGKEKGPSFLEWAWIGRPGSLLLLLILSRSLGRRGRRCHFSCSRLGLILVHFFDASVTKLNIYQTVDGNDLRPQVTALRSGDDKKLACQTAMSVHVPATVPTGHGLGFVEAGETARAPAFHLIPDGENHSLCHRVRLARFGCATRENQGGGDYQSKYGLIHFHSGVV